MFDEGPGEAHPRPLLQHDEPGYTSASCGFFVASDGTVWLTQDFYKCPGDQRLGFLGGAEALGGGAVASRPRLACRQMSFGFLDRLLIRGLDDGVRTRGGLRHREVRVVGHRYRVEACPADGDRDGDQHAREHLGLVARCGCISASSSSSTLGCVGRTSKLACSRLLATH